MKKENRKTFVIYNTKNCSYIVPKEQYVKPKGLISMFEIDTEGYQICDKKLKLKTRIKNLNDVETLLKCLVVTIPELKN